LELVGCLEKGETPAGLFLVMQPVMSLSAPYDSLNFEVLLRLRKPGGEIIPASILIDTAEAYGKIAIIDRWVVTTVINWLESNIERLPNTRFVGVNLSAGSLNDESFVEELFALFSRHKQALSLMCLEITESVALTDIKNMQRLIGRAQALGAKVAIDDFGAGYSSFGYLKGLSADALKLDGSLIKDAPRSPAGMVIIEAIAGLARSLGMRSVGEFAEDLPTIQAIANAGISYAQGYGISKPVTPERILQAKSCVDLIEDPEVLKFVRQIRDQSGADDAHNPQFRLSLH
jgi:EAL domain-containing protein (putative c-di-GMP-specific phosphodiesterase class I)